MASVNTKTVTSSFANGEISRRARWKSWTEHFQAGCLALRNFITGDYGEISRRGGACITGNNQESASHVPYGITCAEICVLEDKGTGDRRRVLIYNTGNAYKARSLNAVKAQHPDFSGTGATDITGTSATATVRDRHLRHASYDGEEYFVGPNTAPFKATLKNGVVTFTTLSYTVEPMNDTTISSTAKITCKKNSDGTTASLSWTGTLDFSMSLAAAQKRMIMLVNYDAESSYVKKLKYKEGGSADDGEVAGWTSPVFPASGTVTLKTEGSYWAGKLCLYERIYSEDGKSYEDVCMGSIVAGGITAATSVPITITDLRSEVYVKLEEFYDAKTYLGTSSSSFEDTGVNVALQMSGSQEVFLRVSSVGTGNTATCDVLNKFYASSFTTNTYAYSAFMASSQTEYNYPRTVCAFQDRLVFGGTQNQPKKIWMSKTGKPLNFRVGTLDDDALSVVVSGSDEEEICWMSPREGLVIGTTAREYALSGSTSAAVTPTSIKVSKPNGTSAYGSVNTESYNGEEGIFCLRAGGGDLLFYKYSSDTYSYVPTVMNNVNAEIFGDGGGVEIAVATRPRTTVYVLRADGKVACLRYFGANGVIGWSVLEFPYEAERIYTARSEDGFRDEVFILFRRVSSDRTALGVITDGDYLDRIYIVGAAGSVSQNKKQSYVSEVVLTPWILSESDAWGKRVTVNKTCLCMNSARGFETSLDGGRTWTEENRSYDAETGAQRELTDAEYELRASSGWRNQAELRLRTSDEHELILNCVRANLTLGE